MLDIKYIRENKKEIIANCKNRLAVCDIDKLLKLDTARRELETEIGECRAKRNTGSKTKPTGAQIEYLKKLGEKIKRLEEKIKPLTGEYHKLLLAVPNLTHPDVRISADPDDNPVLETYKETTKFNFAPKDHVELGLALDLIDFDRAAKVSGAKFYYLKNEAALLEFALIQYALNIAAKHGFIPFITPDLARQEVLEGLGFNPRGMSTQIYNIAESDLSLIGTAEITMGAYHMDEILDEADLPKKYIAVSHCFRTEAGSYSKYSKGIFRVHQFTKVEMFQYVIPENSETAHDELLKIEKEIYQGLDIPYRVVDHCTADLGTPASRTYDLEAWLPGKPRKRRGATNAAYANGSEETGDWAEMTSTSNCTDYQARGLNIKYKDVDNHKAYPHMLNGTAIAVTRTLIAIMENYQQADGSIAIPKILQPYLSGLKVITDKK